MSDRLLYLNLNKIMKLLWPMLEIMKQRWYSYRLENDEEGYYFSIIDMQSYPRLWIDNATGGNVEIVCESLEHEISRKTQQIEKDWSKRFFDTTLNWLVTQVIDFTKL